MLLGLLAAVLLANWEATIPIDEWTYETPESGDQFEHGPFLAISWEKKIPEDLQVDVIFEGTRQRAAQFRIGASNSSRIAVVADEISSDQARLFVDVNRDRQLEESEGLALGDAPVPVTVRVIIDDERSFNRTILFRRTLGGRLWSVATAGYISGTAIIDGQTVSTRRIDSNSNGCLTDPEDFLWLDLNNDNRWTTINEKFRFNPFLSLNGKRWSVRSDPYGRHLRFEVIEGLGRIRCKTRVFAADAEFKNLEVSLASRDGSAFMIQGLEQFNEIPAGEYRVATVVSTIASQGRSQDYVFSDHGEREPLWFEVIKNKDVTIDPIGKLEFDVKVPTRCRSGDTLLAQPTLYTESGLLITKSSCAAASLRLYNSERTPLAHGQSGFA